jgi:hypothetical protein
MSDTPRYLLLAQKTFREMGERGVVLDAALDTAAINEVIQIARRVLEPTDPALTRRLLAPVVRLECGVELRCLPVGVQDVLWRVVDAGVYNETDSLLAQAYAAAHTRETPFWQTEHSPREFRRAVRRWARGLDATVVEVAAALRELAEREYAALEPVPGGSSGVGWLRLLETLVSEYGHDTDYWTWTATSDEIEAIINARNERNEAEQDEMMKAAKAGKDAPRLSPNDYRVRSMDVLLHVRERIIAEKLKATNGQP